MKKIWSKLPDSLKKFLILILILAGAALTGFFLLLGIVLSGSRDSIHGNPEIMIILGCQVMENGPSQSLVDRLDKALTYLEEFPDMTIIVSGGQGSNEPTTEAYAMKQYLVEHGISEAQIYEEGNSHNTHQNLSFSTDLMEKEGLTGDVVIVSSGFHLFRSKMLWERVGGDGERLSVLAAPVTDGPSWRHSHMREPLALVKSFLFDKGKIEI